MTHSGLKCIGSCERSVGIEVAFRVERTRLAQLRGDAPGLAKDW